MDSIERLENAAKRRIRVLLPPHLARVLEDIAESEHRTVHQQASHMLEGLLRECAPQHPLPSDDGSSL